MAGTNGMIRGLDSKDRLLRFFAAKKHNNIPLRVVDILEMRNEEQDYLARATFKALLPERLLDDARVNETRKQWWLRHFPTGWVVLPIDKTLEPMTMEQVQRFQQCMYEYKQVRQHKGEPNRIEDCGHCKGTGRAGGKECDHCGGEGMSITFLEMSPEEQTLAEG